jgi:hypothetical protein
MSFSGLEDTGISSVGSGVVPDVDQEDQFA